MSKAVSQALAGKLFQDYQALFSSAEQGIDGSALKALKQTFEANCKAVQDAEKCQADNQHYVAIAKADHHKDGELEIDDEAIVSISDGDEGEEGAYVQCWVWVPNPNL